MSSLATRATQNAGAMTPDECLSLVKSNVKRFIAALPPECPPEKMFQIFSILIYKNPDLLKCDRESIITGIIQGGSLGLDFTPGMNEAHLIPRWNKHIGGLEAQFQPGYKGLEKLAVGTGAVRYIQPREVRDGDKFLVRHEDEMTHILHEPAYQGTRGEITHVYAFAKMEGGEPIIEVMTASEIEDVHRQSDGYISAKKYGKPEVGPWVKNRKEMELKTLVRRICKRMPRSSDPTKAKAYEALNVALEADNRQYQIEDEERRTDHHIKNIESNNTDHGSGRYADQATINAYRKWLYAFVAAKNDLWKKATMAKGGDVWERAQAWNEGRFLGNYGMSGHILKWSKAQGIINAPEKPEERQYDPLSAIAWDREQERVVQEATDYARLKWEEGKRKVKWDAMPRPTPLEPEDESQETDADDVLDATFGDATDDTFEEGRE